LVVLLAVVLNLPEPSRAAKIASAANPNLPELSTVASVRNLTPEEAARGYPVRVKGVMTLKDPGAYLVFMQDDSAGIYIELDGQTHGDLPEPGHKVEISGLSRPGDFAPQILARKVQELGDGTFPSPKITTLLSLMTGQEDSQWVQLTGVVRSQSVSADHTILTLSTLEGLLRVVVPEAARNPAPRSLVDALVDVQGVCTTDFNARRQLQGVQLQVPDWAHIQVKSSGPEDPSILPLHRISELLQFHPGIGGLHRSRVEGVLSFNLGDGLVFVQDGDSGIRVQAKQEALKYPIGSALEIFGFPSVVDRHAVLQDTLVKPIARSLPLHPLDLAAETGLNEAFDARLVRLEARVLDYSARSAEETITLQFGPLVTDAILQKNGGTARLSKIVPGSVIRITGVYVARFDESQKIRAFQVLIRQAEDVQLLSVPPWWTAQRIGWVLSGVGAVLCCFLAWVSLLRRKVREQTQELREEIAERQRAEVAVQQINKELLAASRQAGMAEVATSVLHNVGNVLNSVNVSATLIAEQIQQSKMASVGRVAELLVAQSEDLGRFMTQDSRGQQLPAYLKQLSKHLGQEQTFLLEEIAGLTRNIDHIKEIVAMQQSYARISGVTEKVKVTELIEDALRLNAVALTRHEVKLYREYDPDLPEIVVEKHKILQILVNLIRNAKYACEEAGKRDKRLIVSARCARDQIQIAVVDNGVGISAENLTRIFAHGFTTRKNGHGFGLHSGAISAKELGGALRVNSDGPGRGATFTLELPLRPPTNTYA
jgi:signal transduction histidine kinase